LANAKKNWNKTPGYTEAETSWFKDFLNSDGVEAENGKFVDIWRKQHPDDKHYTYFSYRFNCRAKGLGWRLDTCRAGLFKDSRVVLSVSCSCGE
jgi:AP endonuclease 1